MKSLVGLAWAALFATLVSFGCAVTDRSAGVDGGEAGALSGAGGSADGGTAGATGGAAGSLTGAGGSAGVGDAGATGGAAGGLSGAGGSADGGTAGATGGAAGSLSGAGGSAGVGDAGATGGAAGSLSGAGGSEAGAGGVTDGGGQGDGSATAPCAENQRVLNHACVACATGTTRAAGDGPQGADTVCWACAQNYRVSAHTCVACADGSSRAGGDDSTGADTACTHKLCALNEHVANHDCLACATGSYNLAGDDATGADSACDEDACQVVLGVTCSAYDQAYIKASNTNGADFFGETVSLSGDTLAVAAPSEDSSATGVNGNQTDHAASYSGAVYVFQRSGGVWTQQAYIKASNTGVKDSFGFSISLAGDTLAVGAPYESSSATGVNGDQSDNSVTYSGAVYVFQRSGGVWAQQAYIKASNTDEGDLFGSSVSLSGDTLAVAAPREDSNATGVNGDQSDNSATDSGAVYVFQRSGAVWVQQAYVKASDTGADFGSAISLAGDTLAVGASDSGAVYVFQRSSGVWAQQAYLKASNAGAYDYFGLSLSLSGDTLAVGAPYEDSGAAGVNGNQSDNSATDSGAVYVFQRSSGVWTQQAYLKASNTDASDRFGTSLSLSGDTLAVGASGEASSATGFNGNQSDNSATDSGAVYVFQRSGGAWTQQAYIKASNTGAADNFGVSVSLSGNTLAVGAEGEDSSATGVNGNQGDNSAEASGAAYVRKIAP